jgi:hypothetical protein
MRDGSDAIADWADLNALVNCAGGASWVSFHHGGGVGIGNSLHAGMVIVADGTEAARDASSACSPIDPGMGVIRHADAGYDTMKAAVAVAAVDGRVSREEHEVLEIIFEALSEGEPPLDLSKAEEKYGDRMVAARGAIEHATQDFLHHVSEASHDGKLSQAAYESLVNGLEKQKRERIGAVMSMLPPPPR